MQNITIGRYHGPLSDAFDGWIEGTRDNGTSWIMYLASDGSPSLLFANRDETGAVLDDGLPLRYGPADYWPTERAQRNAELALVTGLRVGAPADPVDGPGPVRAAPSGHFWTDGPEVAEPAVTDDGTVPPAG